MRTLLLFRHAKSDWGDESLADVDRPLNERGRQTAPRMGVLVRDLGVVPEIVLCSTALRARQTLEFFTHGADFDGSIHLFEELYHAKPETILEFVGSLPPGVETAMVIAHNPGLEDLVTVLTGDAATMPTVAIARIDLPGEWSDAGAGGTLEGVWRPKEVFADETG